MNDYRIKEETLNTILNYLGKQRFIEVSEIISIIKNDIRLIEPDTEPQKDGDE